MEHNGDGFAPSIRLWLTAIRNLVMHAGRLSEQERKTVELFAGQIKDRIHGWTERLAAVER